ncbi:reverse transcriptase [Caerostris darwini]|uniref:Reverse transcriptase n=1 Tax=Caerostris darwini TaxID=1538125 RepID=A0AAV4QV90_9ARAC|nr:reverse transcriptase [Caerostris darwini]
MEASVCNLASTTLVNEVTCGLEGAYVFIDDILIALKTHEDHFVPISALFQLLDHYGVALKPSKCILGTSSLPFLGFHISEKYLKELCAPLLDRVEAIQNFPRSQTILQLRKFLGL